MSLSNIEDTFILDRYPYKVELRLEYTQPLDVPRLVIISYLPNPSAREILRVCIQSIKRFTLEPYELWIIDNNSPKKHVEWLKRQTGFNLVINRTEPLPPNKRKFIYKIFPIFNQLRWGSYANAIGLEIAARAINQHSKWMLTMHMDTAPSSEDWLSYLLSKTSTKIRAVGVHLQKNRNPEGILHILGCLFDFQLFKQLNLNFYPELPTKDVGDNITIGFRQAGFSIYSLQDTFNHPEIIHKISNTSPLKWMNVLRAVDEKGNIIFMHLGRGVRKSTGRHRKGVTVHEWVDLLDNGI